MGAKECPGDMAKLSHSETPDICPASCSSFASNRSSPAAPQPQGELISEAHIRLPLPSLRLFLLPLPSRGEGNLWRQAGNLGDVGLKLEDSGGRVRSGDVPATAARQGRTQATLSSDKWFLTPSQDRNQKTKHLKELWAAISAEAEGGEPWDTSDKGQKYVRNHRKA